MSLIPYISLMIMAIIPTQVLQTILSEQVGLHSILSTVLKHGKKTIGNITPSSPGFGCVGGNPQRMNKQPHDA